MPDVQTTKTKAEAFAGLHQNPDPLVLFNCYDVITAKASAEHFPAVATGSGAVASSRGYDDGQIIPLAEIMPMYGKIAESVECPVSIDLEAGYSDSPEQVAETVASLIDMGIVGINLEDSLSSAGRALVSAKAHAEKISAIREKADAVGVPIFVNARVDTFIVGEGSAEDKLSETLERAAIYQQAGASGIFVPFLFDLPMIERLCSSTILPVNIIGLPGHPSVPQLSEVGVSRVSLGSWTAELVSKHVGDAAATFAKSFDFSEIT